MNSNEVVLLIRSLDEWVCKYPKSNTFAQFHKDFVEKDGPLEQYLAKCDRDTWSQELRDALFGLGDSLDAGGFLYSKDRPYRRIFQGPSYGDYRDDTLDELYKEVSARPDYVMPEPLFVTFNAIKEKLHGPGWVGRPRKEQLDWLHGELQDLISRTQDREDSSVVHAYLYDFLDEHDFEGADLDALIKPN